MPGSTTLTYIDDAPFSAVGKLIILIFDTVDHPLLLDQLYRIGIRGNAHRWMKSYLAERTQLVRVHKHTSRCVDLCSGVPQGSVLGPLLFSIYCLGLDDIFKRHQLQYHMYADDTQLYVEFPRDQQVPATAATNRIALCTADVKTWMASHNLLLNEQKTEVVVNAAPNRSRVHSPLMSAVFPLRQNRLSVTLAL